MKPDADSRKRKRLPANIPPTLDRRGICVLVPDDPEYIALFMGAVFDLTKQSRYDRDPLKKGKQVAAVWYDVFQDTQLALLSGDDCAPLPICEAGCTDYLPSNPRFIYAPNDPFQTPGLTPPGYIIPPFYTNPAIPLPGVLPTDAMVNFAAIPVTMTLPELLTVGFPRIRIPVVGTGEVEVELVRVPQGGIAVIQADDDTGTIKVVDLNSVTLLGLPGLEDVLDVVLEDKVSETEIVEFEFTTPGNHTVEIQFWPNIGSSILLGFGGGLRRVTLCNEAGIGDVPVPEFQIVNCDLEWRPNSIAAWQNLGNVCGADGVDGTDGSNGAAGSDAQLPVGAIIPFGGTSAPAGWEFCHGQAVNRTGTYAELFAVIGTAFGAGNGTTTFNLPDLRQRVPRGIQDPTPESSHIYSMGQKTGSDEVYLTKANIPTHTHQVGVRKPTTTATTGASSRYTDGAVDTQLTTSDGSEDGLNDAPFDIVNRILGTEYIICYQSVNDTLEVDFQIVDCVLQWRKSPSESWVTLTDLTDCTEAGLTPQFRMTRIDIDTQAVEWKYTNQPDVPGAWQTAGYVDDGAQGAPGVPAAQVWRLLTESETRRVLQWRYESDPDIPASYRTVGSWNIPNAEDCGCPDIPSPGEISDTPNACNIAFGLANAIMDELQGMITEYEAEFNFPSNAIEINLFALTVLYSRGIFLSRVNEVTDYFQNVYPLITGAPDVPTILAELADSATIAEVAEAIYTIYDPNFALTDAHTAIIGTTLIASNPGNRAILMYAGWLTAPNIEHWQDKLIQVAIADVTADCNGFTNPPAIEGAVFNWKTFSGAPFETAGHYETNIRLTMPVGNTLGTETRVYYQADDLGAVNGVDYILPAGYVTFPANAGNGAEKTVSFTINDNDLVEGNRQLRIRLTNTVGAQSIIGNVPNHIVTIRDNEDFYLVLGNAGANLVRTDDWTWTADATGAGNSWALQLRSMNNDPSRCFKVLSLDFVGTVPSTKQFSYCNSGAGSNGIPTPIDPVHFLAYANAQFFSVVITIEPA